MGCGKSKHDDVATGNTIITRKQSIINNADALNKSTDTETVVDEKTKLIMEQKEGHDEARLVSKDSPNRYFSSRKEEEATDGVVSEGRSEKSEYLSPRHEAGKENVFSDKFKKVDEGVEESAPKETKNEVGVEEKKEENLITETAEKEKAKDIETEVLLIPDTTASTTVEKNLNDEKKPLIASPSKDEKII